MKTLLLLRHAKSSWDDPEQADHDRPLNRRGQRDAPRMGQLLADEHLLPDLILCSSARRAQETAAKVVESSGCEGQLQIRGDLYQASPATMIEALAAVPREAHRVMVIGHNPGLEETLALLTGRQERLPTAALAQIALKIVNWRDLKPGTRGELVALWQPRELS
jgi:phosphohistidine phosphatase